MIKELNDLREEVLDMKNEVKQSEEEKSLAYELLEESKKQYKRDFVEKLILIVILVITNISWIWYINQYDFISETSKNQSVENILSSDITQSIE